MRELDLSLEYERFVDRERRRLGLEENELSEEQFLSVQRRFRGKRGQLKGERAEQRFIEAWSDPAYYPEWLALVRKATREEDHNEKTDAVMMTSSGRLIRIQIKAYLIREGESDSLIGRWKGVVPLHVGVNHTDEWIRANTIAAIEYYDHRRKVLLCERIAYKRRKGKGDGRRCVLKRIGTWDVGDPSDHGY